MIPNVETLDTLSLGTTGYGVKQKQKAQHPPVYLYCMKRLILSNGWWVGYPQGQSGVGGRRQQQNNSKNPRLPLPSPPPPNPGPETSRGTPKLRPCRHTLRGVRPFGLRVARSLHSWVTQLPVGKYHTPFLGTQLDGYWMLSPT